MQQLFADYFHAGLLGSSILILILLMRCFLIKAPRGILCALWVLAALRLILPFTFESRLSMQPSFETPVILDILPVPNSPAVTPNALPEWTGLTDEVNPAPSVPAPVSLNYRLILATIWGCGCVGLVLHIGVSYLILRNKLRETIPLERNILECDRIRGAFLFGYLPPRIYVPANLDPQELCLIIAHEKAHIARGDNWWKLIGYLCCCLHWYNPLVWLGYWLLCRDIEVACDQRVVQYMTVAERKAYSRALLNCGKRTSGFAVGPVAFGEINLKQRIKKVLSYRQPSQILTVIGVVIAVFLAVCFCTSPVAPNISAPTEPTSVDTSATETSAPDVTTTASAAESTAVASAATTEATINNITATEEVTVETISSAPTMPSTDTEPSATDPPTAEPDDDFVIAQGKWDGGPVTWMVTSDGTLTIEGPNGIQGSNEYIWKEYTNQIIRIVVEDGITQIPHDAFSGMTNVTRIYLSNTLAGIAENAFANCTSLQSVSFPSSLEIIDEYAFFGCSALTTVQFPEDSRLHTIKEGAFSYSAITSFIQPAGVENITPNFLTGCNQLQYYRSSSVQFTGPTISQYENFLSGDGVETAEFYGPYQPWEMADRTMLKSVVIAGSITGIGSGEFANCTSLSSVTITAPIQVINMMAFYGCTSLTSLTLPDSVFVIGNKAFASCGLTEITIPASVREFGIFLFEDSSVRRITFRGDAPDYFNQNTFSGITATIYYPADNPTWTQDKFQNYGGTITWIPY